MNTVNSLYGPMGWLMSLYKGILRILCDAITFAGLLALLIMAAWGLGRMIERLSERGQP